MKVVLFGSSGLLGSEFSREFCAKGIKFLAPSKSELDICNLDEVNKFFAKNSPTLIINCVGYTNVNKAEQERELCQKLNIEVVKNLASFGVPIIHFSTDYVFGKTEKGLEIPENFAKNPLNFYGKTKSEGEELLAKISRENGQDFWIIRTSWLFGSGGDNFITKILAKGENSREIYVTADEIGRPTSARDLAKFVVKNFILNKQNAGIYHLQNTGRAVSWADLARYIFAKKHINCEVQSKNSTAKEQAQRENPTDVQRPNNSLLKNTKIEQNLRDWEQAVNEFLQERF